LLIAHDVAEVPVESADSLAAENAPIAPPLTAPQLVTAITPIAEPAPASIDLSPQRVWTDYLRMRRSAESDSALCAGAGSCVGSDYDPFATFRS
jgi:hypothetical protein